MRPKTSVRQPIIAGAQRQHLSELLRTWRRQPRKRSPLLFGTLLALALLIDSALLLLGVRLFLASVGFILANHGPLNLAAQWLPPLQQGSMSDARLNVHILLLLSGYAALVLAWGVAVLSLGRIVLASPSGERLRRQAALCVWPVRVGAVLLAASALPEGFHARELASSWREWNAQAVGTLLALPGCAVLLHARRREWIQPFGVVLGVAVGFTLLLTLWQTAIRGMPREQLVTSRFATDDWFFALLLATLSLGVHAALRYYFGRQRVLDA